jgi:HEAT repeat protein
MPRSPECSVASLLLALCAIGCGGEQTSKTPPPSASGERIAPSTAAARPKKVDPPKPDPEEGVSNPAAPQGDPVPLALRNLSSEDATDRREAVAVLTSAEYDEAIADEAASGLIRRLSDAEPDVRDAAVVALRKWAGPEHVGKVAPFLARGEKEIRHAALLVLGQFPTAESAEVVAKQLTTAFDRERAANALRQIGPAAEPVLIETYLEDDDPNVRLAAVQVLGDVGGTASITPLTQRSQEDENDPRVQLAAQKALVLVESR